MKRDLDLIRKIMLVIESSNSEYAFRDTKDLADAVENTDLHAVAFHIKLLLDCQYIIGKEFSTIGLGYADFCVDRLTSQGCDYLDSVRNDSIWKAVKDKLANFGGTATLAVVQDLAVSLIRSQLGI